MLPPADASPVAVDGPDVYLQVPKTGLPSEGQPPPIRRPGNPVYEEAPDVPGPEKTTPTRPPLTDAHNPDGLGETPVRELPGGPDR